MILSGEECFRLAASVGGEDTRIYVDILSCKFAAQYIVNFEVFVAVAIVNIDAE